MKPDIRLTRSELAAAIRCARRYPPGHSAHWGYQGEMRALVINSLLLEAVLPQSYQYG